MNIYRRDVTHFRAAMDTRFYVDERPFHSFAVRDIKTEKYKIEITRGNSTVDSWAIAQRRRHETYCNRQVHLLYFAERSVIRRVRSILINRQSVFVVDMQSSSGTQNVLKYPAKTSPQNTHQSVLFMFLKILTQF